MTADTPSPTPATGETERASRGPTYERWRTDAEAAAALPEGAGDMAEARSLKVQAMRVLHLLARLSQPPVPPAADAEGWWVKPEWRTNPHNSEYLDLYLNGEYAGRVLDDGDGWLVFRSGAYRHPEKEGLPTREAAQAALLAAVRPKDAGAKP